jgi:SAM-dependent methyltransferase
MKNSVCPLCGSQNHKFCFSEKDYQLLICQLCGSFFIHPYPLNEDEIHSTVTEYDYDKLKILAVDRHYSASKTFYGDDGYFLRIVQQCESAKSFLDIGCGTGHLLELLSKNTPHIHRVGIELNVQRADFAKRVANCEVFQIPVEQFSYPTKFDVITMINVLSHIPSFDSLFSSIKSLLSDKGKLILKVGEFSESVTKDAVFNWGIPDHLHFLGVNTIDFICRKYGFRTLVHDRLPYSAEIFTRGRWKAPGRSTSRNLIKRFVVTVPFALSMLAKLYDIRHGGKAYSSFIVLTQL